MRNSTTDKDHLSEEICISFAYDFNGTNLAHPIMPELVSQKGLLDINGMDVVSSELALAKRGGGTMYLVLQNPIHGGKDELKQVYIKR